MMRAAFSERNYRLIDEAIKSAPEYAAAQKAGLYQAPIGEAARIGAREEQFASRLARKIPGVKIAERAYVTFLNSQRFGVFSKYAHAWQGLPEAEKELRALAKLINQATGRGGLGPLERASDVVGTPFFSLRFAVSRPQVLLRGLGSEGLGGIAAEAARGNPRALLEIATLNPKTARAVAAQNILSYVGGTVALAALLKQSGLIDVELDPRSTDFGKMRVGNQRIDLWAGFQPFVRYSAQLMTGERKMLTSGNIQRVTPAETISRFVESKFAPGPGSIVDLFQGHDNLGRPLEPGRMLRDLFMPLSIDDMVDAVVKNGVAGGFIASPAVFGAGTQTIVTMADLRNEEAQKRYGQDYEALKREQKLEVLGAASIVERQVAMAGAAQKQWEREMLVLARDPQARIDPKYLRDEYTRINRDYFIRLEPQREKIVQYAEANANDKARNQYYDVFKQAEEESQGVHNDIYYEAIERLMSERETRWTAEQKEYVRNNVEIKLLPDPFLQDYVRFKQRLRDTGWWRLYKQVPYYSGDKAVAGFYDQWQRFRGTTEQPVWEAAHPNAMSYIRVINRVMDRQKQTLRQQNPRLDAELALFEDSPAITAEGRALVLEMAPKTHPLRLLTTSRGRLSASELGQLQAAGLRTLEEIAGATDAQIVRIMGRSRHRPTLQEQARAILAARGQQGK